MLREIVDASSLNRLMDHYNPEVKLRELHQLTEDPLLKAAIQSARDSLSQLTVMICQIYLKDIVKLPFKEEHLKEVIRIIETSLAPYFEQFTPDTLFAFRQFLADISDRLKILQNYFDLQIKARLEYFQHCVSSIRLKDESFSEHSEKQEKKHLKLINQIRRLFAGQRLELDGGQTKVDFERASEFIVANLQMVPDKKFRSAQHFFTAVQRTYAPILHNSELGTLLLTISHQKYLGRLLNLLLGSLAAQYDGDLALTLGQKACQHTIQRPNEISASYSAPITGFIINKDEDRNLCPPPIITLRFTILIKDDTFNITFESYELTEAHTTITGPGEGEQRSLAKLFREAWEGLITDAKAEGELTDRSSRTVSANLLRQVHASYEVSELSTEQRRVDDSLKEMPEAVQAAITGHATRKRHSGAPLRPLSFVELLEIGQRNWANGSPAHFATHSGPSSRDSATPSPRPANYESLPGS